MAPTKTPSQLGLLRSPTSTLTSSGWAEWKEVATQNGISYELYYERVHVLGKSCEEAATMPREDRSKGIVLDGVWAYKKDHCKRLGVSYNTVAYHMRTKSLPFEEALQLIVKSTKSQSDGG